MGVKIQQTGPRVVKTVPNPRGATEQHTQTQHPQIQTQVQKAPRRRSPSVPIPHRAPGPILLSILVPTIPGRETKLASLLATLDPQVKLRSDVELLVLRDNRSMTIGEKRNKMLALARGDYCTFVDDDDAVASDYVQTICTTLLADRPDVLCFVVKVRGHGPEKPCIYRPDFKHETLPGEYHRKPNHLMAWRKDVALTVPFPEVAVGEDTAWAEKISSRISKLSTISRALYVYQFDPTDNSMLPKR